MPLEQRKLPTVSDLRALKGQKQLTMLRYFSLDEAAAAEAAGIDIASVPADILFHPRYREVAPSIFSMAGQTHTECGTPHEYLQRKLSISFTKEAPHTILGWTEEDLKNPNQITRAQIKKTVKLPYWKLNKLGDERFRDSLGLN